MAMLRHNVKRLGARGGVSRACAVFIERVSLLDFDSHVPSTDTSSSIYLRTVKWPISQARTIIIALYIVINRIGVWELEKVRAPVS